MLTVHHALAFLVICVCLLATVLALVAYRRRAGAGALVSHVLALAQTLVVAQVAVGLLLLAGHYRADKGVHYMYGTLAVLAVAWPWVDARARRLLRLGTPDRGGDRPVFLARLAGVRAARLPGHSRRRRVRDVSRLARPALLFVVRNA